MKRIFAFVAGVLGLLASAAGVADFIAGRLEPINIEMFTRDDYQTLNFVANPMVPTAVYRRAVEGANEKARWPGICFLLLACHDDKLDRSYCRDLIEAYKNAAIINRDQAESYKPAPSWQWRTIALACDRRLNQGETFFMNNF